MKFTSRRFAKNQAVAVISLAFCGCCLLRKRYLVSLRLQPPQEILAQNDRTHSDIFESLDNWAPVSFAKWQYCFPCASQHEHHWDTPSLTEDMFSEALNPFHWQFWWQNPRRNSLMSQKALGAIEVSFQQKAEQEFLVNGDMLYVLWVWSCPVRTFDCPYHHLLFQTWFDSCFK